MAYKVYIMLINVFILSGALAAWLLIVNPRLAIRIQQKFYARINWKIEPISLEKELRNTRVMGVILALLLSAFLWAFLLGSKTFFK